MQEEQVSEQQAVADFSGDDPDFVVEAEEVDAEPGEQTAVDVAIEPTEDSGFFDFIIPDNQKIDWFKLEVEYDAERLDFEGASAEVGGINVVDTSPGEDTGTLVITNGYEFGDFFLDPTEAPATLAELEFTVTGEEGKTAEVTPTDDSKVGYGPGFFEFLPVFQHDVKYRGGAVNVVGDGGPAPGPDNTVTATNTGEVDLEIDAE